MQFTELLAISDDIWIEQENMMASVVVEKGWNFVSELLWHPRTRMVVWGDMTKKVDCWCRRRVWYYKWRNIMQWSCQNGVKWVVENGISVKAIVAMAAFKGFMADIPDNSKVLPRNLEHFMFYRWNRLDSLIQFNLRCTINSWTFWLVSVYNW